MLVEEISETLAVHTKRRLRQEIWSYLEEQNLGRFPRPVYNRILNFVGSEKTALLVRNLRESSEAKVVAVNPDSPQARLFFRTYVMRLSRNRIREWFSMRIVQ